jgi:TRAP-type C4-dicarboxylate transport system permease small subunit
MLKKGVAMKRWMRFVRIIDRTVEYAGGFMIATMVALVCYQVFGRYVLNKVPAWSEETVLLLMMWYGFLSISIGFRYKFHLRISFIMDRFPDFIQKKADQLAHILTIGFGVIFIIEGYKFTLLTWESTLPVTKLPAGVQYLIIPITGVLTVLYGFTWLIGLKEEKA